MQDITQTPKGRVRIYACGGAAINIVELIPTLNINPDLLADYAIVQLDTSHSNVTARAGNVENYLLPKLASVDGGGKNRKENEELIRQHVKPILKNHPPGDVNIVLSTGSGSSGSVFAPAIAKELYTLGEAVVVLLIGTASSRIEANNTIGTRRNYQQIAKGRNVPVVMHYLQNSPSLPRDKVNYQMLSAISYIGMLFSRRNAEMDTMDLRNWLNFIKPEITKGLPAQVYNLSILLCEKSANGEEKFTEELMQLGNVLSVATLARRGTATDLPDGFLPEYQAVGFVPQLKDSGKAFDSNTVNFLITDGLFEEQTAALKVIAGAARPTVTEVEIDEGEEEDVQF